MENTIKNATINFLHKKNFTIEDHYGNISVNLNNILYQPIDDSSLNHVIQLSPSHYSMMKISNGICLCCANIDIYGEVGFKIFSYNEMIFETKKLRQIFSSKYEIYADNYGKNVNNWLDSLVVVATSLSTGNLLVSDYSETFLNGEHPIRFLDHEMYYGDACNKQVCKAYANNFFDLLDYASENTYDFIYESLGCIFPM